MRNGHYAGAFGSGAGYSTVSGGSFHVGAVVGGAVAVVIVLAGIGKCCNALDQPATGYPAI